MCKIQYMSIQNPYISIIIQQVLCFRVLTWQGSLYDIYLMFIR